MWTMKQLVALDDTAEGSEGHHLPQESAGSHPRRARGLTGRDSHR